MSDESENDDDLALRMACKDQEALRIVLRRHRESVRNSLIGKYGKSVNQLDIDDALNRAIKAMWDKAETYDKKKGELGAWLLTIAQRAVIDVYRREKRHRERYPLLGLDEDPPAKCDPPEPPPTRAERIELQDLVNIIEKLPPKQKAIIKADLVAGESANAGSLAEMLDTSKGSIYVLRNKAHATIRDEMNRLERERERHRGKK